MKFNRPKYRLNTPGDRIQKGLTFEGVRRAKRLDSSAPGRPDTKDFRHALQLRRTARNVSKSGGLDGGVGNPMLNPPPPIASWALAFKVQS